MSKVNLDEIEDAIKEKVHTPESFHLELINIVDSGRASTLIEAVGVFCADNDFGGDEIAHLVDATLKAKLKAEAEDARMIRGDKKTRLPI